MGGVYFSAGTLVYMQIGRVCACMHCLDKGRRDRRSGGSGRHDMSCATVMAFVQRGKHLSWRRGIASRMGWNPFVAFSLVIVLEAACVPRMGVVCSYLVILFLTTCS